MVQLTQTPRLLPQSASESAAEARDRAFNRAPVTLPERDKMSLPAEMSRNLVERRTLALGAAVLTSAVALTHLPEITRAADQVGSAAAHMVSKTGQEITNFVTRDERPPTTQDTP